MHALDGGIHRSRGGSWTGRVIHSARGVRYHIVSVQGQRTQRDGQHPGEIPGARGGGQHPVLQRSDSTAVATLRGHEAGVAYHACPALGPEPQGDRRGEPGWHPEGDGHEGEQR